MGFAPQLYTGSSFNVGTDTSITITNNSTGQQVAIGGKRDTIKVAPKNTVEMTDGIDDGGRVYHRVIPGGGTGTLTVDRYNGDFEKFIKFCDASFYAGQGQVECTIVQTSNNLFDGSQTVDTYTHCVLEMPDFGTWARTKRVTQTITFYYTEKL